MEPEVRGQSWGKNIRVEVAIPRTKKLVIRRVGGIKEVMGRLGEYDNQNILYAYNMS